MNKLILLFLFSLLFFSCNKNDTPKPDKSGLFVKFFGGAFDDNGFSVAQADDGGFYLAGSTVNAVRLDTNVLIIKIDEFGNKQWEKNYSIDTYGEVARDIVVDVDGNIVVTGYKKNKYGYSDVLLLKIQKNNPDLVQQYIFGDSMANERGYNIVQAPDNAFIVYGSTQIGNTLDMYLLKTNLTDTIWKRQIGVVSNDDQIGSLEIKNDGKLVWCGTVQRNDGYNMRMVYADDFGNLMWDYGFQENDGINQYGYAMDLTADGGYIVAGSKNRTSSVTSSKDIYIVRTNENGIQSNSFVNEFVISGAASQEAYSIITSGSQFIFTGYSTTEGGDKDIYVAKMDESGSIIASNKFGGSGNDVGNKILKTNSGYIVIGTIEAGNNKMMAVYKLNEDLELVP